MAKLNLKCKEEILIRARMPDSPQYWTYGVVSHVVDGFLSLAGGVGVPLAEFASNLDRIGLRYTTIA